MPIVAENELASVLITTKDRCQVVVKAIDSVEMQDCPVQLIVVDDGSSDGTADLVRQKCPKAVVIRNDVSKGIIAARNAAVDHASSNILFTLDDDAIYSSPDTVAEALKLFDHPRVGAIAIPLMNHLPDRMETLDKFDDRFDDDFLCLLEFRGGANALRLDVFHDLGKYSGIGRQNEERGYCVRMLDAGYVVRCADVAPVHHYPDRIATKETIAYHAAKNSILYTWQHVPLVYLVPNFLGNAINHLRNGWRLGCVWRALAGMASGLWALPKLRRRPISTATYGLSRALITGRAPIRFSEIEKRTQLRGAPATAAEGRLSARIEC